MDAGCWVMGDGTAAFATTACAIIAVASVALWTFVCLKHTGRQSTTIVVMLPLLRMGLRYLFNILISTFLGQPQYKVLVLFIVEYISAVFKASFFATSTDTLSIVVLVWYIIH